MNRVKQEIMRAALERIASGLGTVGNPINPQEVAAAALAEAAAVVEYRITARTWYGRSGGEFRAELVEVETGRKLVGVSGTTWGTDAWSYAMRDAMHAQRPDLFPDHEKGHPTIYFREVCRVDYEHAEVARKRDL
jgi:hypothetical protein